MYTTIRKSTSLYKKKMLTSKTQERDPRSTQFILPLYATLPKQAAVKQEHFNTQSKIMKTREHVIFTFHASSPVEHWGKYACTFMWIDIDIQVQWYFLQCKKMRGVVFTQLTATKTCARKHNHAQTGDGENNLMHVKTRVLSSFALDIIAYITTVSFHWHFIEKKVDTQYPDCLPYGT